MKGLKRPTPLRSGIRSSGLWRDPLTLRRNWPCRAIFSGNRNPLPALKLRQPIQLLRASATRSLALTPQLDPDNANRRS